MNNFEEMKLRFTQKFDRTLEPSTARALLHSAKQSSDEDLEDYADRIVKLVDVGYPATPSVERDKLSVEQFLKGCSDVRQAYLVSMHHPSTLREAITKMKSALGNKNLILDHGMGTVDPIVSSSGDTAAVQ